MNRLKEIREKKSMTQIELSRRTNYSQPYLHDLEAGKRTGKQATWSKIAEALEVPVEQLIGGQSDGKIA